MHRGRQADVNAASAVSMSASRGQVATGARPGGQVTKGCPLWTHGWNTITCCQGQ